MASSSGGKAPASTAPTAPAPAPGEWNVACDSCRSAPGIPFCRVEWSFFCAGCASVVHGNNWVVAVTPNPGPNSNPNPHAHPSPYPYPYPFPCPNPTFDPNLVVQLSSDEEGAASGPSNRRGRRRAAGRVAGHGRVESVMRYRQKRKSRTFEKTVRYANRKANAELMPRAEGKFARRAAGSEEPGPDMGGEGIPSGASEEVRPDSIEVAGMDAGEEVRPDWAEELGAETSDDAGRLEADEEVRLQ